MNIEDLLADELHLPLHLSSLCICSDFSIKYLPLLIGAPEAFILVSTSFVSRVDTAYIVNI